MRTQSILVSGFFFAALALSQACTSTSADPSDTCSNGRRDGDEAGVDCGGGCRTQCSTAPTEPSDPTNPIHANGVKDAGETDVDCGGPSAPKCAEGKACAANTDCASNYCPGRSKTCEVPSSTDRVQNGLETDVDCGGPSAPKCAEGLSCVVDTDCNGACNYGKKCIDAPSCKPHLGGDTCGTGEVGQSSAKHESCCRTLPVTGFTDPTHAGKTVYLDKYEITAGRIRAFIADIAAKYGGKPDIRAWVKANAPGFWNPAWSKFLPNDTDGDEVIVDRNLIGDPRGTWPGAPPVPASDQPRKTGVDFQFNGSLFVYIHGNNCSTHLPDAYGFPTFFYPPNVLAKMGPDFPPRQDGTSFNGSPIPASEHLDVKAMNCITNALLAAFCHWDGGQLATADVLDFVTASPASLGDKPGCGTQVGNENPPETDAAMKGGRCADLRLVNATYDAGGALPVPNFPLNAHNYMYPFFPENTVHDKAWAVAAPGRGTLAAAGDAVDQVRIRPGDEPWMDLAGNLNEVVLRTNGGTLNGKFGIRYRGLGYQSARSKLNYDPQWDLGTDMARIERPESKAAFAGGRCMRFK